MRALKNSNYWHILSSLSDLSGSFRIPFDHQFDYVWLTQKSSLATTTKAERTQGDDQRSNELIDWMQKVGRKTEQINISRRRMRALLADSN